MNQGLLALALVAGALAAFNPCGFALLPAYLSLLVADPAAGDEQPVGTTRVPAVLRALRFTAGMTAGFVAVFGTFGLVITPLALSVERYLPYLTILVGVTLLGLGAWLLSGREVMIRRLSNRGKGPTLSWWSQVAYGATFAVASLSCTVGPFLAITSTSLSGRDAIEVMQTYVAYALGMGTVILVLALTVAIARASVSARIRGAQAHINRASGFILIVSGGYVAWYGWYEVRVLSGRTTHDVVVDTALRAQGAVTRFVAQLGAAGLLVTVLVTLLTVLGMLALSLAARRRRRAQPLDFATQATHRARPHKERAT